MESLILMPISAQIGRAKAESRFAPNAFAGYRRNLAEPATGPAKKKHTHRDVWNSCLHWGDVKMF